MLGTSVKARVNTEPMGEDARLEALVGEAESYDEYVPLKERRRREAERRAGKLGKNRRDRERELLEQERWDSKVEIVVWWARQHQIFILSVAICCPLCCRLFLVVSTS